MYSVSLWVGGVVLFFALMRLFCTSWSDVGDCFVALLKPHWISVLGGEFTEDSWRAGKLIGVAVLSTYLVFVFHWKLGDWWAGVLG